MTTNLIPNIPNLMLLVRPKNFGYNIETSRTNSFQKNTPVDRARELALKEFDTVISILVENNIAVKIFEDGDFLLPDAVFPNNWIAHLPAGIITIFPMFTQNRRAEVRKDIIEWMQSHLKSKSLIDLRKYVGENQFLEGTGSIIFDHENKIAFASESPRTNISLFDKYCKLINYQSISFESVDLKGRQIYHTNVMMTLATKFCIINLDAIQNTMERSFLKVTIEKTGRKIIPISYAQMNHFAANAFEVLDIEENSCFIISKTAIDSLHEDQIREIRSHSKLVVVEVSLIEKLGGGGIRCMLVGLF